MPRIFPDLQDDYPKQSIAYNQPLLKRYPQVTNDGFFHQTNPGWHEDHEVFRNILLKFDGLEMALTWPFIMWDDDPDSLTAWDGLNRASRRPTLWSTMAGSEIFELSLGKLSNKIGLSIAMFLHLPSEMVLWCTLW